MRSMCRWTQVRRSAVHLTLLGAIAGMLAGCYHATVVTGAKPSTTTVSQTWASSWIYGLVPPKTVETAAKCPDGVAQVETQLPFVNMLVGLLTLGIYTPMSIVATCAEKSSALDADRITATGELSATEIQATFEQAATRAAETGEPVFVDLSGSTLAAQ